MKRRILKQCLEVACKINVAGKHPELVEGGGYFHWSFLVQNNKIITWGMNKKATPLILFGYKSYCKLHSEVVCYKKAQAIIDRKIPFEIVNIRLTKTGIIRDSSPCKHCYTFLKNYGCKKIYFTTNLEVFATAVMN